MTFGNLPRVTETYFRFRNQANTTAGVGPWVDRKGYVTGGDRVREPEVRVKSETRDDLAYGGEDILPGSGREDGRRFQRVVRVTRKSHRENCVPRLSRMVIDCK